MRDTHFLRTNVVGTSGSGKSTFARALAQKLHCPYIELDSLFWEPNWVQPTDLVFFDRVEKALTPEKWVLDGNYGRLQPIKWKKATAIVWLDYSYPRVAFQSFLRVLKRAWSGQELWPGTGNRESLTRAFLSKDSILLWVYKTYPTMKKRYEEIMRDPKYAHLKRVRIRSPKEAKAFLDSL